MENELFPFSLETENYSNGDGWGYSVVANGFLRRAFFQHVWCGMVWLAGIAKHIYIMKQKQLFCKLY